MEVTLGRLTWITLASGIAAVALFSAPPSHPVVKGHAGPLLPRPQLLEGLGAGYRQLVADYYWVETLQAVIAAKTPAEYRDIYDYANLVTELDPDFRQAYVFAAVTLPVKDKQGRWQNTTESTELLERGLKRFPKYVYLRIMLGYNLMMYSHDYARAANLIRETAELPGAPSYLAGLATRLYAQAGQFDVGIELARSLAKTAPDEATRSSFERRVREIELEEILRRLDALIATYQQQRGLRPVELSDLISAHLLKAVPPDPLGGELVIGSDGLSHSTAVSHRLEISPEDQP